MNLEQLTRNAERVFQGRCTHVRVALDPVLGQTVTFVTFAPSQSVKGAVRCPLTIKLLGDQSMQAPPALGTEGMPRFEEGEEVILFLHEESSIGLTSPVGFGQGKFKVARDRQGRASATSAPGNERLLEGLQTS